MPFWCEVTTGALASLYAAKLYDNFLGGDQESSGETGNDGKESTEHCLKEDVSHRGMRFEDENVDEEEIEKLVEDDTRFPSMPRPAAVIVEEIVTTALRAKDVRMDDISEQGVNEPLSPRSQESSEQSYYDLKNGLASELSLPQNNSPDPLDALYNSNSKSIFKYPDGFQVILHPRRDFSPPRDGKKLLVLDIDHTIYDPRTDIFKDNNLTKLRDYKEMEFARPQLHTFLERVYQHYDIVLWTNTHIAPAFMKLLHLQLLGHTKFRFVGLLDHRACAPYIFSKGHTFWTKPLSVLYRAFPHHYSKSNTVHVDDIKQYFSESPQNGLLISRFEMQDGVKVSHSEYNELARLADYLELIAGNASFLDVDHTNWETTIANWMKMKRLESKLTSDSDEGYNRPSWDTQRPSAVISESFLDVDMDDMDRAVEVESTRDTYPGADGGSLASDTSETPVVTATEMKSAFRSRTISLRTKNWDACEMI